MDRFHPDRISILDTVNGYEITSVSPLVISNDDIVTVAFKTLSPNSNDWIGAYSPANTSITEYVPVKYGYATSSILGSNYLETGEGSLTFNMTNLRSDVKFYYFTNGPSAPVLVANSSDILTFKDFNEPLRNRIMPSSTGDVNSFDLLWSSYNSTQPQLRWGLQPNEYINTVNATTASITRESLCGSPANTTGWHQLGLIHTASFNNVDRLNTPMIYYIFGDADTSNFSDEIIFFVPPLAGYQPKNRPTQVVLMADLGIGSSLSAFDTSVWDDTGPPAINTTMSIAAHVDKSEIDAVFLSGKLDILAIY